jgi:hypothetical protein
VEDALKTISQEEFDKGWKGYRTEALSSVLVVAHIDDIYPGFHNQMVQLFVSKMVESGKKENKETIVESLIANAK